MTELDPNDAFRQITGVYEPDQRQTAFVVYDETTGTWRSKTLADHHTVIANLRLSNAVPEAVRVHFETARNLLLYSWFVYRFIPIAEFSAYASVEYALKYRHGLKRGDNSPKFSKLLERAIEEGWIQDKDFRHHRRNEKVQAEYREMMRRNCDSGAEPDSPVDPQKYSRQVTHLIRSCRNELAHGSALLMPNGYHTLELCCDLINQLFASTGEPD